MSFFQKFTRKLTGQPEPEATAPAARYQDNVRDVASAPVVSAPPVVEPNFDDGSADDATEVFALAAAAPPPPPPPPEVVIEIDPGYNLDDLLYRLVAEKGSDLHLSVGTPPVFRVHGDLVVSKTEPLTQEKAKSILYPIVGDEEKIRHYEACGNLDFAYEIPGLARFRGNYFKQNRGFAAVFREIPSKIPTIDEMGLPPILKEIAMFTSGIVVVTGPTGSGKSTTLAAMINYVNEHRRAHVITIEDPIEFYHPSKNCLIDHREVGTQVNSFADGLRASLREDPDIVLVGEMRDLDTIYAAIKAAETGALVFATLHTNSAAKTIDRIIDVFPAKQQEPIRAMLSESFKAVVAQLLLKKVGGKGRVAVHEILIAEAGFSNMIREGKTSQINNYIQTGKEFGMQTMDAGLMKLLKEKQISKETVLDMCHDPNYFRSMGLKKE